MSVDNRSCNDPCPYIEGTTTVVHKEYKERKGYVYQTTLPDMVRSNVSLSGREEDHPKERPYYFSRDLNLNLNSSFGRDFV